ncbi:replication associated protein [Alces alces faeces associated circular virus MP65]|uniref:replication associated protein n=1 Tax=Alces alces faeces associated circular virus MP65 TaxID=2219143 RepID=UPI000DF0B6C6|nr:replication associated protein [Alces alces faeces associated circular virus MP65]AXB22594.1 replication associated protein [Alces alces faeces associated circular virus MP65]
MVQQIADGLAAGAQEPADIPGVTGPGQRRKGTFRCKNQRLFLTYSQVGSGWDPQSLTDDLERLGAVHRLGKELHQDGGIHYHCYVDFGRPLEFENCHKFCYGGPPSAGCPKGGHCNILVIRRTPHHAWDYAGKDGDVISENCPRPLVVKGQSERKAEWVYCLDATGFDNFYERIKDVDPASLVKSSFSVEHCAKRLFRQRQPETFTPIDGLQFHWESFPKVAQWVLRVLPDDRQLVGGRRPSLILWGASLHGKTDLARSLGNHIHFGNDFSLAELLAVGVENVDFGVLDDLDWTDPILKGNKYKAWLGCQEHFICTDKYLRKESIKWGKPCIFLSNDDPTESLKHSDFLWIQKNCWIVEVPDGQRIASRPSVFE